MKTRDVMNLDRMSDEEIRGLLKCGLCYPTAIALHEIFGWSIGGLITEVQTRRWLPHLVHAYLISPDGRFFDVGGFRTQDETFDFYMTPEKLAQCRNSEFREFGDAEKFRAALRPFYMGASTDPNHQFYDPDFDTSERTEYDDLLDGMLPGVRIALTQRLDIATVAAGLEMPRRRRLDLPISFQ